jgi:hypothetical protein
MAVYALRLRDGNCIMVDAPTEGQARKSAESLGPAEIVTVRELKAFIVQFVLTDEGEFLGTLREKTTVTDLHEHEYPLLGVANTQSYADFGASETDSRTEAVLFSEAARRHADRWDTRDKQIISYAVQQERSRFSH